MKKRKKHDKIVLLAKVKLNTIKVLISKALIDSHMNHHELFSVNNELREHNEMKEEIEKSYICSRICCIKILEIIVLAVRKIFRNKIQVPEELKKIG